MDMNINLKNILNLTIILFLLNSCGFSPIYYSSQSKQKNIDYHNKLILVKIKKHRSDIDHELHKNLTKILNPYNLTIQKKYLLDIKLTDQISSTFTTSTGSSGRNKVILTANYKLTDIDSQELIGYGESSESSDFDVSSKRFANYTTEEEIKLNITKVRAKDIRDMIINDLYIPNIANQKEK